MKIEIFMDEGFSEAIIKPEKSIELNALGLYFAP
jgi:hypothetical protein